jgi:hypothetical protein
MSKYRVRTCPNCNYYVAFTVSKPIVKPNEATVTSFCLNCGYKIPVHSVIRGIRRAASPVRRGLLRLVNSARQQVTAPEKSAQQTEDKPIPSSDCARHLRAIGQDLENLRLTRFNLEYSASAYLVWSRADSVDSQPLTSLLANRRLRKLWTDRIHPRSQGQEEYVMVSPLRRMKRYRYTPREIESIELTGQRRRRLSNAGADGHSLSQLLRTVGALVQQRNQKLLGISWQELAVSVVFENDHGQREIEVFRPDHLYDLWVRMYLRRNNRALSDFPR